MLWTGARRRSASGLLLTRSLQEERHTGPARRPRFYGWPMLAGLSAAEIVSWGVLYYSFAVFVQPIERETGWSRTAVMGAFSLALLVSGVAAVPVGHWIDRRRTRAVMAMGTALAVAMLVVFSTARSLPVLYATWAGLGVAMAMTLYEPAFALVAAWFDRQRDRALSVLTVCGGLASTLIVPLSTWLVTTQGWRAGAVSLALLLACTALPVHALVLRDAPAAVGLHADGADVPTDTIRDVEHSIRPVLADVRFWKLAIALTLASFVSVATTVHVIPYLLDNGVSAAEAAAVLGLAGLMQLPGRIAFEPMRRRLSPRALLAGSLLSQALGVLVLVAGTNGIAVVLFAFLFGAGGGISTLLRASMLGELYGFERYGRVAGIVSLFTTVGRAAGPVAASLALAMSGRYGAVLAGLALTLVVATTIALFSTSPTARANEPAFARRTA